jgi:hypothetical protein
MITVIDIQKAFRDTWGYIALPYPEIIIKRFLSGQPQFAEKYKDFSKPELRKRYSDKGEPLYYSEADGFSDLFLPVWLNDVNNDNPESGYLLPLTMMDMSCKKNIITTPLVNHDGTVKEEISRDDWEINIRGMMVGRCNSYPDDLMQILVDWWNRSEALKIRNAKTAICMDGENVVITSIKFPEVRGVEHVQPYELKLTSDREFSLIIS